MFHGHIYHISHPSIKSYTDQEKIYLDTKYEIETSYISPESSKAIKWLGDREKFSRAISELSKKIQMLWASREKILSMK